MSSETVHCGKRTYIFESRITKNGHRYVLITEKSFGRLSKVMVFQDHHEAFRDALERAHRAVPEMSAEPVLA